VAVVRVLGWRWVGVVVAVAVVRVLGWRWVGVVVDVAAAAAAAYLRPSRCPRSEQFSAERGGALAAVGNA
jgi:hypothetical protein